MSEHVDNIHFYRQVINSLGSAVIVIDKDGTVITVNPAARHHLETKNEPLAVGKHFKDLILPAKFIDALNLIMQERRQVTRSEIVLEENGVPEKEIGYSVFLLDGPDDFNGIIFLFTDMTERRKLERIAELNKQLAYVGELAAGVVHELRNPLSVISGLAQLMMLHSEQAEKTHQDAKKIFDETQNLNRFVTHFLGFARPFEVSHIECEVVNITSRVIELCAVKAKACKVEIAVHCAKGAPTLLVDPEKLTEAISGIVINAIEVASENSEVRLEFDHRDDKIFFRILDEGPGIHVKANEDIFQPFFTRKKEGTGLGLSIAYRIITAHGGTITHGNRPEGGARFEIALPLEPAAKNTIE